MHCRTCAGASGSTASGLNRFGFFKSSSQDQAPSSAFLVPAVPPPLFLEDRQVLERDLEDDARHGGGVGGADVILPAASMILTTWETAG